MRCLAFLLCLLSGPVVAQTTPASLPAPVAVLAPPTARTAADTVKALHQLFKRRRRNGGYLVSGAIAADLVLAGVSTISENNESKGSSGGGGYGNIGGSGPLLQFGMGGYALLWGVALAPVAGVGVQQLIAYSPRHEAKVIASYERTHQLPARWQRRVRKHLR
ncbi:hypothetical protein Q5H93_22045 [Hymenobacter sp. ASUV-10]|uniref:Uncharacterized protein n=1 Tax=Hymenobacter aranciens TaxID=3063996 RepID=A0ABT9BGP6_9BACT|nr:hypothetical protein [Hymenobacter sp. ASUV-10]MDO7877439.1 hypothetical protein [Hymenobacter sp. ASUV-10]